MRQNLPNIVLFLVLTAAALTGLYFADKHFFPPKPKPKPAPPVARELAAALGGTGILGVEPFDRMLPLPSIKPPAKPDAAAPAAAAAVPPPPKKPTEPRAYIALGDDSFNIKAVVTNHGAGIQQLLLTEFKEANRLGRPEIDPVTGKPRPMHLIPGFLRPHYRKISRQPDYLDITPNLDAESFAQGKLPTAVKYIPMLSSPSYVTLHYLSKDDPARPRDDKGQIKLEDDAYPVSELADRNWKVVSIKQPKDGSPYEVVFETELEAPYWVKLRKTFSLAKTDYDFKLKLEIQSLPKRVKGVGSFRYQIVGPIGMPVEGEWYTNTFRNIQIGWLDGDGTPRRTIEDPASIHSKHGGDKVVKPGRFTHAATTTQFFAGVLAVDGEVDDATQPWEYVRPTREETEHELILAAATDIQSARQGEIITKYDQDHYFLYDVSFRAVSKPFDLGPDETLTHSYAGYHGPAKVRLLRNLADERAVPSETIDRYLTQYQLHTLTDYHSPNWFARQLNRLFWTDLLIFSTNFMHGLLGYLSKWVGTGFAIMLLTVIVRLTLFFPSRRQQMINAHMQARIAKIKPELDKIQEKYKDDFLMQQQERSKLMRKAGINQTAQLGGCLLFIAQAPILFGLYFCLQESVLFRLEPFLWFPNLAAPDMLLSWSESIPVVSDPDYRFGSWLLIPVPCSITYLGPFFTLLPLAAVALFWVQQKLTMPPPTSEMEEQQRSAMKFALIFTGLFFYKVAAGLCLYFIISGLWTLAERKLVPKPDLSKAEAIVGGDDPNKAGKDGETTPQKPTGWLGKKMEEMRLRMEELQRQADNQRQIRNDPSSQPPKPSAGERADKRKKKRRD